MKRNELKKVMAKHLDIRIDGKLLKKLHMFRVAFANKNEDHIQFLGGNLLGIHLFVWLEEDTAELIEDILEIDDHNELQQDILECEVINPDFKVSTNYISHCFLYLLHQGMKSRHLSSKERAKFIETVGLLYHYKLWSSMYKRAFRKHRANEAVSLALYESLDRKSLIKKYQTWNNVMIYRASEVMDKLGGTIEMYDDDYSIVKVLNSVQGALKSILKYLYDNYKIIRDKDAIMRTYKDFVTFEGEEMLKDKTNNYLSLREKLHTSLHDRNSFINPELTETILKLITTTTENNLVEVLEYFTDNINSRHGKKLTALCDDLMTYTFQLMYKEGIDLADVPTVVSKISSMYRSSRSTSTLLLDVRDRMYDEVESALGKRSESIIASTRIAVMIYIVTRALLIK